MKADKLWREIDALPTTSGVYRIYNETGDNYIGSSVNIRTRCFQHFSRVANGTSTKVLTKAFAVPDAVFHVEALKMCSRGELDSEERKLITELKPTLNSWPSKRFNAPPKQGLITIAEAADLKGCSRQAIHAAIRAGRLKGVPERVEVVLWKVDSRSLDDFKPNPNMKRPGRKSSATG